MFAFEGAYDRSVSEVNDYLEKIRVTEQYFSSLKIPFTTEMDFIKEILPPCFELPEKPDAFVSFSVNRSTLLGYYTETRVGFACRFKGRDAWYLPTGFANEEYSYYTAREVRGYAFHHGVTELQTVGRTCYAAVVRHGLGAIERCAGQTLIEAEVSELKDAEPPKEEKNFCTGLYYSLHSKGKGFEQDPAALLNCLEETSVVYKTGKATLQFFDGQFDRLSEIPVKEIGEAVYKEGISRETVEDSQMITEGQLDYGKYYFGTRLESMFDIPLSGFVYDEVKQLYDFID